MMDRQTEQKYGRTDRQDDDEERHTDGQKGKRMYRQTDRKMAVHMDDDDR